MVLKCSIGICGPRDCCEGIGSKMEGNRLPSAINRQGLGSAWCLPLVETHHQPSKSRWKDFELRRDYRKAPQCHAPLISSQSLAWRRRVLARHVEWRDLSLHTFSALHHKTPSPYALRAPTPFFPFYLCACFLSSSFFLFFLRSILCYYPRRYRFNIFPNTSSSGAQTILKIAPLLGMFYSHESKPNS